MEELPQVQNSHRPTRIRSFLKGMARVGGITEGPFNPQLCEDAKHTRQRYAAVWDEIEQIESNELVQESTKEE